MPLAVRPSRLFRHLLAATLVWALLTELRPAASAIGVLAIAGATAASLRLARRRPARLGHPGALPRLLGQFLLESVRGGIDVARRAFSPRMPLNPTLLEHRLALETPPARVALAGLVSVQPGSLVLRLRRRRMLVHLIDDSPRLRRQLAREERRVRNLLVTLETPSE